MATTITIMCIQEEVQELLRYIIQGVRTDMKSATRKIHSPEEIQISLTGMNWFKQEERKTPEPGAIFIRQHELTAVEAQELLEIQEARAELDLQRHRKREEIRL